MPAVKAVFLMDKGMGIIDTYIGSFRNFDDFEGRSSRAEFWIFHLLSLLVQFVFAIIGEFWMIGAVLQVVFFVVLIVPSISLVIRRLHDTGTSGWFLLMLFLPLFNFLVLCLLLFYRSDPYDNGYGPPGNSPQKTVPDPS
ncbi:DUF805 domain-containing protein [Oxalobacter paraformigenes]|nr:DUF805 domain-containing protein [Oxalobacter paraformigenes]